MRTRLLHLVGALTAALSSIVCAGPVGGGGEGGALAAVPIDATGPLAAAQSWGYQLQGLDRPGALERLERAQLDLLVVEPTRTVRGSEDFDARGMVERIHSRAGSAGGPRLALAYLNVGQAEDYRDYWKGSWRAPTDATRGTPSFILTLDPDGWPGNYPVAFWDARWKAVLYGSEDALVDRAIEDGFDGVYLDWVLGYGEPAIVAAARAAGVDPARAMAELIRDLRAYARTKRAGFLVVPQNAAPLVLAVPELARWIDGVAQEDLSFRGEASDAWNDPAGGDVPVAREESQELVAMLERCLRAGVPVFTVDYALDPGHAQRALAKSRKHGFVPCVSRTSLAELPDDVLAPR